MIEKSGSPYIFLLMQKLLLVTGILCIALALAWPLLVKLPLGRLPGDIFIDRPGFKIYIPVTTMIVVSVVLSLLAWLFRK